MEDITGFISIFMSAISNCLLYSKDHSAVDELTAKTFSILSGILNESGSVEIMIIDNDLVIDKNPVREIGIQGQNLIKRLKRKGVSHIHFLKGLTLSELKSLIADISKTGKGLKSLPHMKPGTVDAHLEGFTVPKSTDFLKDRSADLTKDLSGFSKEQLEKAMEEYNRISPFRQLHLAGFEEIVSQFVLMLKKEVNVLKLLKPARTSAGHDDTHATNVAVLTVFQAQSVGIREEFHGEIGLAAFLHDVGKLVIPRELVARETTREGKEKTIMDLHPQYGAQYLARIPRLTRLAPIVAFEHHLRYDGQGYPKLKLKNTKQHICSQMTAIADAFDTLRGNSPNRRPLDLKEVLQAMKIEDPGLFNPFLIDNFIRSIHLALSG